MKYYNCIHNLDRSQCCVQHVCHIHVVSAVVRSVLLQVICGGISNRTIYFLDKSVGRIIQKCSMTGHIEVTKKKKNYKRELTEKEISKVAMSRGRIIKELILMIEIIPKYIMQQEQYC